MSDMDPSVRARRKAAMALALLLAMPMVFFSAPGGAEAADVNFRRGDANVDDSFDISDALSTFGFLFLGNRELSCHDAADANDSGTLDLTDGIFSLNALFTGGPAPPAPGDLVCGPDPTPDVLDCQSYDAPGCNDDPTPPAIPAGLSAAAGNAQVALNWADNTEPDLAGYNVYRSTTAGSGHVKLNGPLILSSSYTDSTAANETTYYYQVTAVDAALAESLHSAEVSAKPEAPVSGDLRKIGHVLDRLGYGPTQAAIERVNTIGLTAYIEEQLDPSSIDESGNTALNTREAALYTTITPSKDTPIVARGTMWSYLKGTAPPPANWNKQVFDASSWAAGASGFGYGDGDDLTILGDMLDGYMSVFIRRTFQVPDPAAIERLIARVDYDDGFVMYLNGTEVARRNLTGNPPAYNAAAGAHEAEGAEEIDITNRKNLLIAGANLLAVQVHNTAIDSSDLTMVPELLNREILPGPPIEVIKGIDELKQLLHVRGIYSQKQLQTVMAEFWENHFTTDFDKVAEIFDGLQNSDAADAMSSAEAMRQAAQVKETMHQFFTENALGNFGDLLLASATDPAMILYLDNYINKVGKANENYGREILELFAFGVDNRYTQKDIEEIAKCFTGWSTRKVAPENAPSFPESAESPPQQAGVLYDDTSLVGLGAGWKYRKGTAEPSPDGVSGDPTTAWTTTEFNAAAWLNGSTGIGYGDGDDATVLGDMQGSYTTVYLRRTFNVPDPSALQNLLLEAVYDDGFVAYLNGVEVTRSENMGEAGSPPSRTALPSELHEAEEGPELYNLNGFLGLLNAGANVLAIQVHNISLDSSDLSMLPRLFDRKILPGSIENGDPKGVWTFYFNPDDHDRSAKVLFQGTPYQINIPAGRTGALGLRDALDPVKAMVNHPSTAEFICIKLIEKFVSDELSLGSFKANTAPAPLRALLADAIAAWNSTTPKGNIRTVLEVILDPVNQESEFWAPASYRAKVKTPIEFINSSLRVLDGLATGSNLPQLNEAMGMSLLTRDEPDGFSELGRELMSTDSLLERITFVQAFAENSGGAGAPYRWNTLPYLDSRGLDTAEEIVDHFADLMFHGSLTPTEKGRLLEFLSTDNDYNPRPLTRANTTDFQRRVQEFVGLLLSLPQWSFQ